MGKRSFLMRLLCGLLLLVVLLLEMILYRLWIKLYKDQTVNQRFAIYTWSRQNKLLYLIVHIALRTSFLFVTHRFSEKVCF